MNSSSEQATPVRPITAKRKWRRYLDTSVFGGCFDSAQRWSVDSRRVIDLFSRRDAVLLFSELVERELLGAPANVQEVFAEIPQESVEPVPLTAEIDELAGAYVRAGVGGARWLEDCTHVAAATIARADAIVSWNFKHIVRLDRIKGYNNVNLSLGYGIITIISPREVDFDE